MKIYISSTVKDLAEYRRAVYAQLRKMRGDVIAMEDYTAGSQKPVKKCIRDVADSDLHIGIFAWRYGYVPADENPETEIHY